MHPACQEKAVQLYTSASKRYGIKLYQKSQPNLEFSINFE